jgi:hypothetical protein
MRFLMESNLLCRPLSRWTETSLDAFEDYDRQKNIQLLNYSFFAKGPIPDIGSGGTFRTTPSGTINGRQFTNLPLWDMYYAIGFELFKQQSQESFTGKLMLIEVKDPKSLMLQQKADGSNNTSNLYNYEFIIPENKADALYQYMLEDINRYSEYTVTLENRPVHCLVLVRTSQKDKLASKGGEKRSTFPRTPSILRNAPLRNMINMLNGEIPLKKSLSMKPATQEMLILKFLASKIFRPSEKNFRNMIWTSSRQSVIC